MSSTHLTAFNENKTKLSAASSTAEIRDALASMYDEVVSGQLGRPGGGVTRANCVEIGKHTRETHGDMYTDEAASAFGTLLREVIRQEQLPAAATAPDALVVNPTAGSGSGAGQGAGSVAVPVGSAGSDGKLVALQPEPEVNDVKRKTSNSSASSLASLGNIQLRSAALPPAMRRRSVRDRAISVRNSHPVCEKICGSFKVFGIFCLFVSVWYGFIFYSIISTSVSINREKSSESWPSTSCHITAGSLKEDCSDDDCSYFWAWTANYKAAGNTFKDAVVYQYTSQAASEFSDPADADQFGITVKIPSDVTCWYDPDDGTPAKLFDGSRYGHLVGLVIGSCFMMCAPCLCFGCLTFIKAMKS